MRPVEGAAAMRPERWQEVKSALQESMEVSGAQRLEYLEQLGNRDAALRAEVESLLHQHESAGSRFLNTPAAAVLELPGDRFVGRQLGPYRLIETIGTGGMGEVYRAVRADAEYEQQVAVKLVRTGMDLAVVGARLRAERQILAAFEQPNIARLLDGGTTEEGVPYLVMELIDGEPITAYCEAQRLDTGARLELFLSVCSAVQYAHQHMVVHRDLKPSNILVTRDGVPKLLDFGIAKILEPSLIPLRTDATIAAQRILTPEYASPEQLRGDPVSAASDVYSLGIILYELLTGVRPYPTRGMLAHEALQTILEQEPQRPSTLVRQRPPREAGRLETSEARATRASFDGSPQKLSRRLRGDLDNIVLMALRREPERRYSTVAQFAQDIQRHLLRLPVIARRPTLRYRASSFVARHTIGVAASVLIIVALTGAVIATTREARIAEAQHALAARHFASVRRLADTFIFQVHDAIKDLPGATPARNLLVSTALTYLDSLAQQAGPDLGLRRELAEGYARLGDVQGNPNAQNAGHAKDAAASYAKALALFESVIAAGEADPAVFTEMATTHLKRSWVLLTLTAEPGAAAEESRRAVEFLSRLAAAKPDDVAATFALVDAYAFHARNASFAGDDDAVTDAAGKAVAIMERLYRQRPAEWKVARYLAKAYTIPDAPHAQPTASLIALRLGQAHRAVELDRHLRGTDSKDELAKWRDLGADWNSVGIWSHLNGQFASAVDAFRAALAAIEKTSADSHNAQVQMDLARVRMNLGRALVAAQQLDAAEPLLLQDVSLIESILKTNDTLEIRYLLANCEQELGRIAEQRALAADTRKEQLRKWKEANTWFAKSVPTFEPVVRIASLSVYDGPPVENARAGLARSAAEIRRLEAEGARRPHL